MVTPVWKDEIGTAFSKSGFGVLVGGKAAHQYPKIFFLAGLGRESGPNISRISDFEKPCWKRLFRRKRAFSDVQWVENNNSAEGYASSAVIFYEGTLLIE